MTRIATVCTVLGVLCTVLTIGILLSIRLTTETAMSEWTIMLVIGLCVVGLVSSLLAIFLDFRLR